MSTGCVEAFSDGVIAIIIAIIITIMVLELHLPHEATLAGMADVAPRINDYLTQLEQLREAVGEGEESGASVALDMTAVITDARRNRERERS